MKRVAVMIPCYNEAAAVARVIADFRRELPEAEIHVFDNASSDDTATIAAAAGASVTRVPLRGKGEVVRAMFRTVQAETCVMVDGDGTYPAARVHDLLKPIAEGRAEMVVGTRLEQYGAASFRPLHIFGNSLVIGAINALFEARLTDAMSGYRAFSRRFMITMPVQSHGFEIETEMTLHALEHRLAIEEVPVAYGERIAGGASKLRTFYDGRRVLATILRLYKDYRPMAFFGGIGVVLLAAGVAAGVLVTLEFLEYGRVPGVARAVLAVACSIVGVLSIGTGVILETVNRRARELYLLLADQVIERR